MTASEIFTRRGDDMIVGLGSEAIDRTPVRWTGLEALIQAEPWMQGAPCGETDPDSFFPERGEDIDTPRKVCASCDVREECLEYAIRTNQQFGIWGGLSTIQRKRLVSRRNARRAADEARERWGI